jgi:hypothetical protein
MGFGRFATGFADRSFLSLDDRDGGSIHARFGEHATRVRSD